MEYVIGIDLGTSGTKTVLFDREGRGIASALVEYPLYQAAQRLGRAGPPGLVERRLPDPAASDSGKRRGSGRHQRCGHFRADARPGDAGRRRGRCCAGPSSGATSAPPPQCEEITQLVGKERLIQITANPALTGLYRLARSCGYERTTSRSCTPDAAHILLPKDYVRYMLTGEFATEVSDASGMQLLDVPHRQLEPDEVLEKLGIDPSIAGEGVRVPGSHRGDHRGSRGPHRPDGRHPGGGRRRGQRGGSRGHRRGPGRQGLHHHRHLGGGVCPHRPAVHRPPRPGAHLLLRRAGCLARDGRSPRRRGCP